MRIGELASLAGSDVDTIRFYEKSASFPSPRALKRTIGTTTTSIRID